MSNTMQGRRIPYKPRKAMEPGDYKFDGVVWICKPPRGPAGHLANHAVIEHGDGTITVSPSILTSDWHGWLEHGVWREA